MLCTQQPNNVIIYPSIDLNSVRNGLKGNLQKKKKTNHTSHTVCQTQYARTSFIQKSIFKLMNTFKRRQWQKKKRTNDNRRIWDSQNGKCLCVCMCVWSVEPLEQWRNSIFRVKITFHFVSLCFVWICFGPFKKIFYFVVFNSRNTTRWNHSYRQSCRHWQ